jgi:hypothetical protein
LSSREKFSLHIFLAARKKEQGRKEETVTQVKVLFEMSEEFFFVLLGELSSSSCGNLWGLFAYSARPSIC